MINRNFFMLLAGQLVSQIGDKFHMIALSFWVLKTTGSAAKMGAVLAASLVPSLVIGFFSGAFIDRYNRKNIIIGTDLLRGLILAVFAILFYFELVNFYVILIMQMLLSVITLGIYLPAAYMKVYRYLVGHTEIHVGQKQEGRFGFQAQTGRGFGLLWGQMLLTAVTLGIYTPWAMAKVGKYFLSNTYVEPS